MMCTGGGAHVAPHGERAASSDGGAAGQREAAQVRQGAATEGQRRSSDSRGTNTESGGEGEGERPEGLTLVAGGVSRWQGRPGAKIDGGSRAQTWESVRAGKEGDTSGAGEQEALGADTREGDRGNSARGALVEGLGRGKGRKQSSPGPARVQTLSRGAGSRKRIRGVKEWGGSASLGVTGQDTRLKAVGIERYHPLAGGGTATLLPSARKYWGGVGAAAGALGQPSALNHFSEQ